MFLTYKSRFTFIGTLIMQISLSMNASLVLQGDAVDQTISFSQPIKAYAMGTKGQLYVAAHAPGAGIFALADVGPYGQKFSPLTPEKVFFNDVSTDNPLFNAKISFLTLIQSVDPNLQSNEVFDYVAVVKDSEPSSIYLINSILANRTEMLAVHDLKDASGTQTTSGIIQMTSYNNVHIYAAVTDANSAATFGQGNSGIAIVARQIVKETNKAAVTSLTQITTVPLNNASPFLYIDQTSTGTILNNNVDLNWYGALGSLYVGLQITATSAWSGGAQALVIGSWMQQKIITPEKKELSRNFFNFEPITVPTAFVSGANNIVGAVGANVTISIHQTRPLLTSTYLNYLAILGGVVDTPDTTKRNVYALPLVRRQDQSNGMLAKKNAVPSTFYGFTDPATQPGDLFSAGDVEVTVGGGQITAGDITTILACNDAVYAVVSEADSGYKPGVFHSQALFDNLGRIKGWTNWRRVTGNFVDHIFGAALGQSTGNFFMITGNTADTTHTVKRTEWGAGDAQGTAPMITWLNTIFPESIGGIQGLYDIPVNMPGVDHISLAIALGNNQVAMVQTGTETGGIFNPLESNQLVQNPLVFEHGIIDQAPSSVPSNAIAISGGALQELGVIKAVALVQIGTKSIRFDNAGILFVGGTNGLALLDNGYGHSWYGVGLGNNFAGLMAGTAFKKVGSYRFVRKLIADGPYLYVVADSTFDRIDIEASDFTTGELSVVTLATLGAFPLDSNDTILDAVVSQSLALLGTSKGLFRSGLQVDVSSVTSIEDVDWQQVCLPEGLCTARQIFSITPTGLEQDLTTTPGGMIYILDTNHGKDRAMVHRFTITPEGHNQFLVQAIPDFFIKNVPSYFVQFSGYRTWINTDGSLFFQERDRNRCDAPLFALLPEDLLSGIRIVTNKEIIVPLNVQGASIIQPIVRSSASGPWLLAQNSILSVNE